jgi:hypothetical protein
MHSTYLNHCMIFDTTKEAVNRQKQKKGLQVKNNFLNISIKINIIFNKYQFSNINFIYLYINTIH